MRKSLQRALTLVAAAPVAAASLVAAAPAASAAIPVCPAGTAVTEFDLLGSDHYRVAVHTPSSTQTVLCLQAATTLQAVIVVKSGVGLTPPSVTQTPGSGSCVTRIIDMTSPVALALSVGLNTAGPAICFGKDGTTTTVSLNAGSVTTLPDVEVWLPAGSDSLYYWCYSNYYTL